VTRTAGMGTRLAFSLSAAKSAFRPLAGVRGAGKRFAFPLPVSRKGALIASPVLLAVSLVASRAGADPVISHVVRPGDTLASIAERYYGDPRRESVLVAENGLASEGGSAIVEGLRLVIPSVGYHTVQEGETWAELAKRFYGDARRAFVLLEANSGAPGAQPDPGAELLIPYPLRHVARQNETVREVAAEYYGRKNIAEGTKRIYRFNRDRVRRARLQRGSILLVPLSDLVLSQRGREFAKKQASGRQIGGEVRDRQARIDAELPLLRENVSRGRYAEAVALGSGLLGGGQLTGNQVVTIQKELAIAFVALGQEDLAARAFAEALKRQPDLELDSISTSPKVLRALKKAAALLPPRKKAK
jgi:LysM repeat protein